MSAPLLPPPRQAGRAARPRWPTLLALVMAVVLLHVWLTTEVASRLTDGMPQDEGTHIKRMEATYVSELKLSAPPVAAAPPKRLSRPGRPKAARRAPPALAASKPADQAASAAELAAAASSPQDAASEALAEAANASASAASASAPSSAPASAPLAGASARKGPPFVWPKATRVSFKMQGYFRGPIYGQATVEWLRQADHYQVHLDASVGPSFAPLGSWNLTSEGAITPEGLVPSRYEHINRLLVKTTPARIVQFEEQSVLLPTGERIPRVPGMQDPASQFIQLAYRFIMNPDLLKVGNTIEMPLALLRKAETLAYDVVGEEVLHTPIGDVPTFHVRPRRMVAEGGTLPAEIWFAPGLQYLPVRILVRLDAKTYMDLQMEHAPQQVPGNAPESPAPSASQASEAN